jgi:hypothetical protein
MEIYQNVLKSKEYEYLRKIGQQCDCGYQSTVLKSNCLVLDLLEQNVVTKMKL